MKTKKAAASTAAKNDKLHRKAYPKDKPLSRKIQIGKFLLLLITENEQSGGWKQFEGLLRQYYERGAL